MLDKIIVKIKGNKQATETLKYMSGVSMFLLLIGLFFTNTGLTGICFALAECCDSLNWMTFKNDKNFYMRAAFYESSILLIYSIGMAIAIYLQSIPEKILQNIYIFFLILYLLLTLRAFKEERENKVDLF